MSLVIELREGVAARNVNFLLLQIAVLSPIAVVLPLPPTCPTTIAVVIDDRTALHPVSLGPV